jgi:hypothetical protein
MAYREIKSAARDEFSAAARSTSVTVNVSRRRRDEEDLLEAGPMIMSVILRGGHSVLGGVRIGLEPTDCRPTA